METFVVEQQLLFWVNFLSLSLDFRAKWLGARSQNEGHLYIFCYMESFKVKHLVLFRVDFLWLTSDLRCGVGGGLDVKI